jgi:hypothetical protein
MTSRMAGPGPAGRAPVGAAPPSAAATAGDRDGQARELVSVIVVVSEEPEPLPELYAEYAAVLRDAGYPFEFIFVAHRDQRRRVAPLMPLVREGAPVHVLEAAQNVGETALLRSAVNHCTGSIIATIPASRRVEAEALPLLVRRVEGGAQLVLAMRTSPDDAWANRFQRRMVHSLVKHAVGGDFHDLGSGVRVMRPEVLREVPLYGESLRFLPLLAQREGFIAEEVAVPQHSTDTVARVHSPGTYVRRAMDLAAVFFLIRFREKPLRFFGLVGSLLLAPGGLILAVMFVQKLAGQALADRPLLVVAVLLVVVGVQAIALGLVGEIIVHAGARRTTSYRLSRRVEP